MKTNISPPNIKLIMFALLQNFCSDNIQSIRHIYLLRNYYVQSPLPNSEDTMMNKTNAIHVFMELIVH